MDSPIAAIRCRGCWGYRPTKVTQSHHTAKPYEHDADEPTDPRPDVEALFREVLGDNIAHESVQRLIDGVVELVRKREVH